jgi:hypothetical protein
LVSWGQECHKVIFEVEGRKPPPNTPLSRRQEFKEKPLKQATKSPHTRHFGLESPSRVPVWILDRWV